LVKFIDFGLGALAIGIGVLHSFIVTPQIYDALIADAFWFFAAGLSIIFVGLLNILRTAYAGVASGVRWASLLASFILLAMIVVYAVSQNAVTNPVVALQILVYAGLIVMTFVQRNEQKIR